MIEWLKSSDEVFAAVLVVVLTPVVRILWLSGAAIFRRIGELWGRRIERCPIRLGMPGMELPEPAKVHCLLVRYGTDAYLEKLASDREKFEGRLRLEVEAFDLKLESGTYSGEIELKVHRRLGTQFKLFFKVADQQEAEEMAGKLRGCDGILDASAYAFGSGPKVWILLDQYPFVTSVDGASREGGGKIRNNYYFPV